MKAPVFDMGECLVFRELRERAHRLKFEEILIGEYFERRPKFGMLHAGGGEVLFQENITVQEVGAKRVLVPVAQFLRIAVRWILLPGG